MIYGDKVYLRPFTRADLPVFDRWANDLTHNSEFNTFGLLRSGSLEAGFAQAGLLDTQHGMLVVAIKNDDIVAGDVSYHHVSYGPNEGSRAYNIGITIAPEHRGKGYGVEAQQLLAAYLFATYPVMRVEAATDVTNTAERRALEKAGFTREGILRKAQWRAGDWHDLIVYSKIRGE
jgi:RimJ/RimL family protein N-acetyltransferase